MATTRIKKAIPLSTNKYLTGNSIFLGWVILCISLFVVYPGSVSYIHWTRLSGWRFLLDQMTGLNFLHAFVVFLVSIAGIIFFFSASISLGCLIIKTTRINTLSGSGTPITRMALLATELLIGHGVFSLIFLTLAGISRLTPIYVIIIQLVGFLSGYGLFKKELSSILFVVKLQFQEGLVDKRDKIIIGLALTILFISLLYSSARISYDSTSIYFSNAKLTALAHKVQYFLDDTFVVSAFQTAIQFTALIQVFGDQSARMLSWGFGATILIFSLALGEALSISRQAKPVLLVLTLTSTAFLDLMGDGKVDLMSSAPAIAAIYWMVIENKNNNSNIKNLILIGFLCGLAIVGRPFNAFLLGIFFILSYIQYTTSSSTKLRKNYKSAFLSLFWIAIGASGLGIYHLFANWMILGSPFAFVTSITSINVATGPWDFNSQRITLIRLLYPIFATYLNTPQTLGNMSPLVIAFLPALLLKGVREKTGISKELTNLTITGSITLLLWVFLFFSVLEYRYVLFLWIILFIPMAEVIYVTLNSGNQSFQNTISGLVITFLLFIILRIIFISLDTYSPVDRSGNPQCDTSRFCEYLKTINQTATPGDRILTLSAFRYYLRTDLFVCSTKHDEYKILHDLNTQNMERFWLEVYRQGYKYIAYENDYTTRHLQLKIIPSPENTPDWIELIPIFGKAGDLQVAYKIIYRTPPIKAEMECRVNPSGNWEVRPLVP